MSQFPSLNSIVVSMRKKKLDPFDLIDDYRDNIINIDSKINSFTYLPNRKNLFPKNIDIRSNLAGLPIAVKDIIDVKGWPTKFGSDVFRNYVAPSNSSIIKLYLRSGGTILGKTQTHEFATGIITPKSNNPWDIERITGGSSGGSAAAVSAGLTPVALGTDTAGSVRIPAAFCGVVGFKTPFGKLSMTGIFPESPSLDTIGFFSRSVNDLIFTLSSIGYKFDNTHERSGYRFGIIENFLNASDNAVSGEIKKIISKFSTEINASFFDTEIDNLNGISRADDIIDMSENATIHYGLIKKFKERYTMETSKQIESGSKITIEEYINAVKYRKFVIRKFKELSERFDFLISPTQPITAPRKDDSRLKDENFLLKLMSFTSIYNFVDYCAISLPVGKVAGLPVSIQIAAHRKKEKMLIDIAGKFEKLGLVHSVVPEKFEKLLKFRRTGIFD